MPESVWERNLPAAAEEVLETMFFAGICGEGPPPVPESPPPLAAQLRFEGEPSGTFAISVSRTAARTLAENFLAAEDPETLSGAELESVVCELANMICGSLLSRVESEAHFHLSSPAALPGGALPPGQYVRGFDLGDGTLRLSLALEEHV